MYDFDYIVVDIHFSTDWYYFALKKFKCEFNDRQYGINTSHVHYNRNWLSFVFFQQTIVGY